MPLLGENVAISLNLFHVTVIYGNHIVLFYGVTKRSKVVFLLKHDFFRDLAQTFVLQHENVVPEHELRSAARSTLCYSVIFCAAA